MKLRLSTSMVALGIVLATLLGEAWQMRGSFHIKLVNSIPVGFVFQASPLHAIVGACVVILIAAIASILLREAQ